MRVLLVTVLLMSLCACQSQGPYMIPTGEAGNAAPGDAYAGEGMMFRKPMPDHRNFKRWKFYYKHCQLSDDEVDFTRHAYECSGPYY